MMTRCDAYRDEAQIWHIFGRDEALIETMQRCGTEIGDAERLQDDAELTQAGAIYHVALI